MSHQKLDLAAFLRREGYRMTAQRQMVLDAVCEAQGHATPEEIYERVRQKSEAVNRATVYRVLQFLRELKLITETSAGGGRLKYEIAGDRPHHHLLCRNCGTDIELFEDQLTELLGAIGQKYEFEVDTSHITLLGLCGECSRKE